MPKSALTGTEKKAKKRDINFTKEQQRAYLKQLKDTKGLRKQSASSLQDIAAGEKGLTTDIGELMKQFQQAQKFAEQVYAPQKTEALHNFQQEIMPTINTQLGSNSKTSSALNQALAASAENLHRGISSDINNLSGQLLNQSQQSQLNNLQAMLQASGAGVGQQITPAMSGFGTAPSYLPKGGPGLGKQILGGFIKGAGNFIGGGLGGGLEAYGNNLGGTTGIGGQGAGGPNASQLAQLAMMAGGV